MKHEISYDKFWSLFPFRPVSKEQVEAINFIIRKLNVSPKFMLDKEYAYIMATIKHECGDSYLPQPEWTDAPWLKGKNLPYLIPDKQTGHTYYGRGYVQLTWRRNYEKMSKELGIDLVWNPDLALDPEIAWKILEVGMYNGLFTGKRLGEYLSSNNTDFYGARRVINGVDQAFEIKKIAEKFWDAIK